MDRKFEMGNYLSKLFGPSERERLLEAKLADSEERAAKLELEKNKVELEKNKVELEKKRSTGENLVKIPELGVKHLNPLRELDPIFCKGIFSGRWPKASAWTRDEKTTRQRNSPRKETFATDLFGNKNMEAAEAAHLIPFSLKCRDDFIWLIIFLVGLVASNTSTDCLLSEAQAAAMLYG